MLKNRLFISYFSTMLLYLLFAGILFYMQKTFFVAAQKSEEHAIRMSLASFVPEATTPVEQLEQEEATEEPLLEEEPATEEKPVIEPEVIKEPLPVEEPEIKEKVIPEPVAEKPKPVPVVKKVKKKPQVKKLAQKKTVKKKQARQKASVKEVKASPAEQNQFLANIRAKINKHKSYPRIAQKRGMQGSVKVNFSILSSGQVGQISVEGPQVFHASAISAVKSAFPIDVKKAPISLPVNINIALQYKIR
ncbi:TonB family protein [Sulfurovum sp.]|uniref:energy transducer TonB n=1 Tax=Sulfurovum sp. TaxID=1969726 RepID=UPI0028680E99|nr:TonB family protein [Sulfurovum sp.]